MWIMYDFGQFWAVKKPQSPVPPEPSKSRLALRRGQTVEKSETNKIEPWQSESNNALVALWLTGGTN